MSVLVGRKAPDFIAGAVLGNGEIVNDYCFSKETQNKYALVFFYPLDFTFVCPSELIALDKLIDEFKARNVEVVGVSIDSKHTHNAWRNTPINQGGIGPVRYTLVADVNHAICQNYGVEDPDNAVAFRGAFIIDQKGIVRSQIVNDDFLGRDINEILRLFDALQFHEKHGEVCPANWNKGKAGMVATREGVAKFLSNNIQDIV
jgi:peroxiredoxin (alkyl hydroperoxide reductase subunit C)